MPKLVRFMLHHALNGMALGCIILLLACYFDLGGIGSLLATEPTGLATAILFFQTALTFGAVNMGAAVMMIGIGEEPKVKGDD